MILRILQFSVIFALILVSTSSSAEELETRSYVLPNHGSIQLKVPKSWQSEVSQPPNDLPPTIIFSTSNAHSFQVMLTPLWATRGNVVLRDPTEIKRTIERIVETVKTKSVEREISIKKLEGLSSIGYYFSATDKAPNPGEYKYLTQGMVRLGELEITFTALTNDDHENVVGETIAIMESAEHTNDGSSSAIPSSTARPDAIQITQRSNEYLLAVPVSQLIVSVPRNGLLQKKICCDGATDHPRYFCFENSANQLQISGWFESEQGFSGIEKFWASETTAWKKDNLPKPRSVQFAKFNNWDAIVYDLDIPDVTNSHIRAHWIQAGTWIDIHLSITSNQSSKDARSELESFLKAIAVTEKNSG